MTTRMLIDARHPEETRVAVLKGNRIEEFDFESAEHKQIKGNIYLAKVTRVEPSLQAAFVDFGGNRHGFLAFGEIHPDYYQIPKEDREALLAEEAEHAAEEEALRASEDADDVAGGDLAGDDIDEDAGGITEVDTSEKDDVATIEAGQFDIDDDDGADEPAEAGEDDDEDGGRPSGRGARRQGRGRSKEADELRAKRMALRRRYKIQDVIHRRQVLLVQVVKEERGNKGAALTTYLSLAGRYCVLMPNSSHGGGISRKISSAADRKRLKSIIGELGLPKSMGCIVRTAGLQRTRAEIKRDFDYLARLWDEIRENTLGSSAPAPIHSDSDLVKRAIRDIYNREIEDVVVEGGEGYTAARAFMKLLMPSHARKVKQYADPVPLFQRYGAEDQLTAMYDPVVQLKSGGYIVINPTEALVSIDINSGRSTKEYGIEATALNTNLEAAREIARQLRLRDMAGLVVIDFIDMEHGSNVRKVEKAMKDALRDDRARIQVGRISSFGLMEMSRQRLRTGVLEATTRTCPHCDGSGLVRTASSAGLSALRMIEDEAAKGRGTLISLYASTEAAIYLLNAKRADLAQIEDLYGVDIEVLPEGENEGAKMRVASSGPRPETQPRFAPIVLEEDDDDLPVDAYDEAEFDADDVTGDASGNRPARGDDEGGDGRNRKRRKRRRGGKGRRDEPGAVDAAEDAGRDDDRDQDRDADQDEPGGYGADDGEPGEAAGTVAADGDDDAPRKRRRRSRRRRGRGRDDVAGETATADADADADHEGASDDADTDGVPAQAADQAMLEDALPEPIALTQQSDDEPAAIGTPAAPGTPVALDVAEAADGMAPEAQVPVADAPAPKRTRRKRTEPADADAAAATTGESVAAAPKPRAVRRKPAEATTPAAPFADTPIAAPADDAPAADLPGADLPGADMAGADMAGADMADAAEPAPAKPRRTRRAKADAPAAAPQAPFADLPVSQEPGPHTVSPADLPVPASPSDVPAPSADVPAPEPAAAEPVPVLANGTAEDDAAPAEPRRGWWQRTFGT